MHALVPKFNHTDIFSFPFSRRKTEVGDIAAYRTSF